MGVTHAHSSRPWSRGEEIANSFSHGVGLLAALIAVPLLLAEAVRRGNAQSVARASVFGITILLLYLTSTLFHALPDGRAKRIFEVLDNAAVFLLIAGTYTPLTLGLLRGSVGVIPLRCRLDAGRGRSRSDRGGRLALPGHIHLSLSRHGMAVSHRFTPTRADHATARPAADLGWRARIYGRARILGKAVAALPPSRLALVRSYRDGLPLPRDPLVCDLTPHSQQTIGEPRCQKGLTSECLKPLASKNRGLIQQLDLARHKIWDLKMRQEIFKISPISQNTRISCLSLTGFRGPRLGVGRAL